MTLSNPTQLVDAFKKSGEFDRLRRELLVQFQAGDGMTSFMNRVEDIARKKLDADEKLQYMPPETVHRELMLELDRYPIVERAVADVRMLSDQSFTAGIRTSVEKLLREDRGNGSGSKELNLPERPRSSIPEGRSAVGKSPAVNSRPLDSLPNSRSQSPDSMKMSTPEPQDVPSASLPNGINHDAS